MGDILFFCSMSIMNYYYSHFLINGDQKPSRLPKEVKPGKIHIEKTNSTPSAYTESLIIKEPEKWFIIQ